MPKRKTSKEHAAKKKKAKANPISVKDVPTPPLLGRGAANKAARQLRGRAGKLRKAMKDSGA